MSLKRTARRSHLSALAAAVCVGAVSLAATPATATGNVSHAAAPAAVQGAGHGTRAAQAAPPISRDEVIARAKTWLTANNGGPVPYNQELRWNGGYRQDCSGYASMALKLPEPGPNTVALKNDGWTKPMSMNDLAPGDLVIKANSSSPDNRHAVIFDRWVDDAHTSYHSYEQAGGGVGTRWAKHTYGLRAGDGYHAYHPVNLNG